MDSFGYGVSIHLSKLLETEHNFIQDFMKLVDDTRFLLAYLANAENAAKSASATDSVMKTMSAVIEASRFIHKFTKKSAIGMFIYKHQ